MVELVDTRGSGPRARKGLQVQVLSRVPSLLDSNLNPMLKHWISAMTIQYRAIDRENLEELRFVAETDSKIPLLIDPEYTTQFILRKKLT